MKLSLFDSSYQRSHGLALVDGENIKAHTDHLFTTEQSFLFLNDQLPAAKRNQIFQELQTFIELTSPFDSPSFLIPTSGTTSSELKIVVIKRERFLNAAKKVNLFLDARTENNWLVSLPLHHVAGLSILARSFLKQNNVFYVSKWQPDSFTPMIEDLDISFCSLVPTQIFDLILKSTKAPRCLRCVLVGGSALPEAHFKTMHGLGWPLVKTFGMTETSAFFSTGTGDTHYQPLPGVEVRLDSTDHLSIRCDSLFDGYIQQQAQTWHYRPKTTQADFWSTEDRATLIAQNQFQLLGRDQSLIKINGEFVNLNLLNGRLNELITAKGLPTQSAWIHFVPNQRSENELVAIFAEQNQDSLQKQVIQHFNQLVLPFERINWYIKIPEIVKSDLGKVKFGLFSSDRFKENYFENRKNILD